MKAFLEANGIEAMPKYISTGSLGGCWRLYNHEQKWTPELSSKLSALGFLGFDHKPLNQYSGNGGLFSVFVAGHNELLET